MKVHHCFIRPIQHYKFFILCQVPPLSHKPYDKSHTLPEFPNLDNIMHDKNEGLSPLKAGQIQVVTKMAVTRSFLNLNDKALEVLGVMICPLLAQQEAERPIQALGSCRSEGRRELTWGPCPAQSPASTKAEIICFPGSGQRHAMAWPSHLLWSPSFPLTSLLRAYRQAMNFWC